MGFTFILFPTVFIPNGEAQEVSFVKPSPDGQVRLLPSQPGRVFSMYGCPGELDKAKLSLPS